LITSSNSPSLLTPEDRYLFSEGTDVRSYEKLGAHPGSFEGERGTYFTVWAPNASTLYVIGDFNDWRHAVHSLYPVSSTGLWEGFIPGVGPGSLYKYALTGHNGYRVEKADPYGFASELRPKTASVVQDLSAYSWNDSAWMQDRRSRHQLNSPISIYEVHLGSWRRVPEEGNRWLSYREMAPLLVRYVRDMGFTHVEFLPVNEHPFDGSWGYQVTGYFAPTRRFGWPQDFMALVDTLHQHGIGVILDWVPGHFPTDEHGLSYFDGTHLYEHADPRLGYHAEWGTDVFNYGRAEVSNFLLSNALFWLDKYHIDGLRVDAVASMLYLDYSRKPGEWIPNKFGGRENLEAVTFLRRLNEVVYKNYPDVLMIAEESTSWPMVSRPTYLGGLGFEFKWDMGWMHDTLAYLARDPVHRRHHHNELTFRGLYTFTENFLLPLSHDEVVYGKGSLLNKMAGDWWQKFANLRLLFGYQYTQPGKKLLFMGGEFAQWSEWNHETSLDWSLLEFPTHQGLQRWVKDLNALYSTEPSLYETDSEPRGFEWVDCSDSDQSILTYLRFPKDREAALLVACNFTPVPRPNYRIGVPWPGRWKEVLNSDAAAYAGSGYGNWGGLSAFEIPWHGRPYSLNVTLPPLSIAVFKGTPS